MVDIFFVKIFDKKKTLSKIDFDCFLTVTVFGPLELIELIVRYLHLITAWCNEDLMY